jgi:hypothetical protein
MPGCLDLNPYCDRLGLPRGVARHPLAYAWTNHPAALVAAAAVVVVLLLLLLAPVVAARWRRGPPPAPTRVAVAPAAVRVGSE